MKIGILTYHRSHNYGALLQAVALRYELKKMGHEVFYIDYWPRYHKSMYDLFTFYTLVHSGVRGGLRYLYKTFRYYQQKKERITNFESFIERFITPYCGKTEDTYDMIVHGSDQIWRKQLGKAYNPVYFGVHDNIQCKSNISYAASMGDISKSPKDTEILKKYLSHLDRISVREADLLTLVHGLGFTDATLGMDPTFLLSKEEWERLIPEQNCHSEKYLLYYKLLDNSFNEEAVYAFAKLRGWNVRVLFGNATTTKENDHSICTAGPTEFISLVRNAEFVFTSSYHGLAFSLIFQKPFYAAFSIGNGRAKSILEKLNLMDYLLLPMAHIPQTYSPIDYVMITKKIREMNKDSILYLKNINSILN